MKKIASCLAVVSAVLLAGASLVSVAQAAAEAAATERVVEKIDEYKSPGLESEISGIFPHPTNDDLYYAIANLRPAHRYGHTPKLKPEHRGKLLTVTRSGDVVSSVSLAEDDFGGLAFAKGKLYTARMSTAEIVEVDPKTWRVLRSFALPSPAGGLGYDADRNVLIAQLYVDHPQLAIVDLATGEVVETVWSDESAMGLAKVDGDWLCTWSSGWDPGSFSELRVLDQQTGQVLSRHRLNGVHSSLAPAKSKDGMPTFLSLVTVDSRTGETVIRRYSYTRQKTARAGDSL